MKPICSTCGHPGERGDMLYYWGNRCCHNDMNDCIRNLKDDISKLRIGMNRISEHWESGVDDETEAKPWYRQMRELLDHYEGEYK